MTRLQKYGFFLSHIRAQLTSNVATYSTALYPHTLTCTRACSYFDAKLAEPNCTSVCASTRKSSW